MNIVVDPTISLTEPVFGGVLVEHFDDAYFARERKRGFCAGLIRNKIMLLGGGAKVSARCGL